ncbi:ubiquitin-binding protein CUE5 ASCRUDRAFT_21442, partial [Ascoidea rubescens DSM 1968]
LQDAFPTIDQKYINAVLIASSGNLDSAFSALLYLSDPNFKIDLPTPKNQSLNLPSNDQFKKMNQLEQDELLAKRLAKQFEMESTQSNRSHQSRHKSSKPPNQNERNKKNKSEYYDGDSDSDDPFTTFIDEDLPQIKKEIAKGFEETKLKVNNWVSELTKKFNQNENDNNTN